jgi:hypothetical protein
VCFFIRENGKRNTPAAFLSAANSQLARLAGSPEAVGGDYEALRAQFLRLWDQARQAARARRPLLLLVDGLDGAADAGKDQGIAGLLPTALGDYVHVVVSCRADSLPTMLGGHPIADARTLRLGSLNCRDVEAMLVAAGVHNDESAPLAERIHGVTGGSPMYVGFDIAERGAGVLAALERNPLFEPCHMNYNVLGNAVPHVHAHVLPRYFDDPSPGMPLTPWVVRRVEDAEFARQLKLLRRAVQNTGRRVSPTDEHVPPLIAE